MRLFIWHQIGLSRIFFASHKDEEIVSNLSGQRTKCCEQFLVQWLARLGLWADSISLDIHGVWNQFTDLTWEEIMVIIWFSVPGMKFHVTPPAPVPPALFMQQRKFLGWCLQIIGTTKVAEKGTFTHSSQQTTYVTLTKNLLYLHWESFSCP